jgi:hypothetical protein
LKRRLTSLFEVARLKFQDQQFDFRQSNVFYAGTDTSKQLILLLLLQGKNPTLQIVKN